MSNLLDEIKKVYGNDVNLSTPSNTQNVTQNTQNTYKQNMSNEDILNIYNSIDQPTQTKAQEIPQLEANTLPNTNLLRNNLMDNSTGRTDGETKALEDYLYGIENLKKNTYKQDYNSTINDLQNQLADTTAQRTEGETKALEEYLSGLQGLQSEIDKYNAPKVTSQQKSTQKTTQTNVSDTKTDRLARAKELGSQLLAEAKKNVNNDSLAAHGYSLSPNEQRDYDRAQEAIKNAQAKSLEKSEKRQTAMKQIANTSSDSVNTRMANNKISENNAISEKVNEAADIVFEKNPILKNVVKAVNSIATNNKNADVEEEYVKDTTDYNRDKAVEKWIDPNYTMTDAEKKVAKDYLKQYDVSAPNSNVNELTDEQQTQLNNYSALRERLNNFDKANDNATVSQMESSNQDEYIDKWLDNSYKMNSAEKKAAKDIIDNYDAEEFNRNKAINEMPSNLSANEQRDYLRGNNAYEPVDTEYADKINALRDKISGSSALANGIKAVTPGANLPQAIQTLINPDNAETFAKDKEYEENTNQQNPLAYYGGLIGGGIGYSLAGQGLMQGTKYADAIGKLTGANGGSTNAVKSILGDALLDAPVDLATDTIPELLQNIATGSDTTGTDLLKNVALNSAFNLGASTLVNLNEIPQLGRDIKNGVNKVGEAINDAYVGKNMDSIIPALTSDNSVDNALMMQKWLDNSDDVASGVKSAYNEAADDVLKRNGLSGFTANGSMAERTLIPQSNSEVDEIINNKDLKELFENEYNVNLTGSKSAQRKTIKQAVSDANAKDYANNYTEWANANTDDIPYVGSTNSVNPEEATDEFMKAQSGLNDTAEGVINNAETDDVVNASQTSELDSLIQRRKELQTQLQEKMVENNNNNLSIFSSDNQQLMNEIEDIDEQIKRLGGDTEEVLKKTENPVEEANNIPGNESTIDDAVENTVDNVNNVDNVNENVENAAESKAYTDNFDNIPTKEEMKNGSYTDGSEISEEAKQLYRQHYLSKYENFQKDSIEYKQTLKDLVGAFDIDDTGIEGAEANSLVDNIINGMDRLQNAKNYKAVKSANDDIQKNIMSLNDFLTGRSITFKETNPMKSAYSEVMSYLKGTTLYISPALKGEFPEGVFSANKFGKNLRFTTKMRKGVYELDAFPDVIEAIKPYVDITEDSDTEAIKKLYDFLLEAKNAEPIEHKIPYDSNQLIDFSNSIDNLMRERCDQLGIDSLGNELGISKVFTNTGTKQGMTDVQYAKNYNVDNFRYQKVTDKQSMEKALRTVNNRSDEQVISALDKSAEWSKVDTDTAMLLHKKYVDNAMAMEDAGQDATEMWGKASSMLKRVQTRATAEGQALQALNKWNYNTPEGQLAQTLSEIRKEVDKKYSKGYSATVDYVADQVKDIMNNTANSKEAAAKVKNLLKLDLQTFADEAFGGSGYQLKFKLKGQNEIVSAVEKGESIEDVISKIKKANGIADISASDEAEVYKLLRNADTMEEGSRAWKEERAKAMKILQKSMPSSLGNKVKSILYDNMLASLKTTLTRNMGSNIVYNSLEDITKGEKALVDRGVSIVTGNRSHLSTVESAKAGAKGFVQGAKDTALDYFKDIHTTRSGQEDLLTAFNKSLETFNGKGVEKIFREYDKLVGGLMELGDRPIYEKTYQATKTELKKLIEKYGSDGIRSGIENANNLSDDEIITLISRDEALKSVMQNTSSLTNAMNKLREALNNIEEAATGSEIGALSQSAMPFTQVPANMLDRMIEYTPGVGLARNIVRSKKEIKSGAGLNQRRMVDELTHNINGSLLMYGATKAAENGMISDEYSDDTDKKKIQQANNYQEYALQNVPFLKEGRQMDISDIPIVGPMLTAGKKINNAITDANGYNYDEDGNITGLNKNAASAIPQAVVGSLGALTQDSLYQGLARMMGAENQYSGSNGLVENAVNTLKSSGNQLEPSFVRQIAQYNDPYKRDLGDYGTDEYYMNLVNNGLPGNWKASDIPVLQDIPLVNQLRGRESLPIKLGTDGNPVLQGDGATGLERFVNTFIVPYTIATPHYTETYNESERLENALDGSMKSYTPVIGKSELEDSGYDMENYNSDDLYNMREDYYTSVENAKKKMYETDYYKGLSNEQKENVNSLINSAYKAIAKENVPGSTYSAENSTNVKKAVEAIKANDIDGLVDYLKTKDHEAEAEESGLSVTRYDNAKSIFSTDTQFNNYTAWETTNSGSKAAAKISSLNRSGLSLADRGKYLAADQGDYNDTSTKAGKAFAQGGYEAYYMQKDINANGIKDYNNDGKKNTYDYIQYAYGMGYSGSQAENYAKLLKELNSSSKK